MGPGMFCCMLVEVAVSNLLYEHITYVIHVITRSLQLSIARKEETKNASAGMIKSAKNILNYCIHERVPQWMVFQE